MHILGKVHAKLTELTLSLAQTEHFRTFFFKYIAIFLQML